MFSRTCLEGISFKFFVCFIFNVSLGSAPKRKNFDIQRNTRVGSGGQFTSNRLSCHLIEEGSAHDCEAKISSKSPIINLKTSKLYKSLIDKGDVNNDCDGGEDKSWLTPRSRPASH